MQKNSDQFSMQDAMRMAKSPEGQQLINLLRSGDPETLNNAMKRAAEGDWEQAKASLTPLLSSPEIRALLEQMGRNNHE